jgi:hypothetical protein
MTPTPFASSTSPSPQARYIAARIRAGRQAREAAARATRTALDLSIHATSGGVAR